MIIPLRRREFLASLGAFFLATGSVVTGGCFVSGRSADKKRTGQILSSFFSNRDMAAQIGHAYTSASGEEERAQIIEDICAKLPGGCESLVKASPEEQRRIIVRRIASDFEEGETVEVEGWLLSRTEARLCLLSV